MVSHRGRRGAAGVLVGAARQRGDGRRDAPRVAALDGLGEIDARLAAAAVLELGDEIVDVGAIGGELVVEGLQLGRADRPPTPSPARAPRRAASSTTVMARARPRRAALAGSVCPGGVSIG